MKILIKNHTNAYTLVFLSVAIIVTFNNALVINQALAGGGGGDDQGGAGSSQPIPREKSSYAHVDRDMSDVTAHTHTSEEARTIADEMARATSQALGTDYVGVVSRESNGTYTAEVRPAQQEGGNGGNNGGNTNVNGIGGLCLPDLRVAGIRFVDQSGRIYWPASVPVDTVLTPQVTVRNHTRCKTNTSSSYSYSYNEENARGDHRTVTREVNYKTWINVRGNTGGRYPVRLTIPSRDYERISNNKGPTAGNNITRFSFPIMRFTNTGTQRVVMVADDPETCRPRSTAFPWTGAAGCINETGQQYRGGNQFSTQTIGSGRESNNRLTQNITVVDRATPNDPECSNTSDDDGDGISDINDPGCHTDGDPDNPTTYDPSDDDESDEDLLSPPVVTVSVTTDDGSTYHNSPGPISVSNTEVGTLEVRWDVVSTGTGLHCDGVNDFAEITNQSAPGQRPPQSRPTPGGVIMNYGVTCTDSNGTDQDNIGVRVPPAPSNISLQSKRVPDVSWSNDNPFVIGILDDTIDLRWSSLNALSCYGSVVNGPNGTSAGGFTTNDTTNGTDNVDSPDVGNYALYGINCSSLGGTQYTQVEVQRPSPIPILTIVNPVTDQPATLVDIGTTVHISWDTNGNDPSQCNLTGPNWNVYTPLISATGDNIPFIIQGESDFTLDCSANIVSPTTGEQINASAIVTKRVNVTSNYTES